MCPRSAAPTACNIRRAPNLSALPDPGPLACLDSLPILQELGEKCVRLMADKYGLTGVLIGKQGCSLPRVQRRCKGWEGSSGGWRVPSVSLCMNGKGTKLQCVTQRGYGAMDEALRCTIHGPAACRYFAHLNMHQGTYLTQCEQHILQGYVTVAVWQGSNPLHPTRRARFMYETEELR